MLVCFAASYFSCFILVSWSLSCLLWQKPWSIQNPLCTASTWSMPPSALACVISVVFWLVSLLPLSFPFCLFLVEQPGWYCSNMLCFTLFHIEFSMGSPLTHSKSQIPYKWPMNHIIWLSSPCLITHLHFLMFSPLLHPPWPPCSSDTPGYAFTLQPLYFLIFLPVLFIHHWLLFWYYCWS